MFLGEFHQGTLCIEQIIISHGGCPGVAAILLVKSWREDRNGDKAQAGILFSGIFLHDTQESLGHHDALFKVIAAVAGKGVPFGNGRFKHNIPIAVVGGRPGTRNSPNHTFQLAGRIRIITGRSGKNGSCAAQNPLHNRSG